MTHWTHRNKVNVVHVCGRMDVLRTCFDVLQVWSASCPPCFCALYHCSSFILRSQSSAFSSSSSWRESSWWIARGVKVSTTRATVEIKACPSPTGPCPAWAPSAHCYCVSVDRGASQTHIKDSPQDPTWLRNPERVRTSLWDDNVGVRMYHI